MGLESCLNGPGHLTKMAAMPIYGKNRKNLLLRNQKAEDLETWYTASGAPSTTKFVFMARSNLVPCAFVWEKGKPMDFSETIVVNDIKIGRCS